MYDLEVGADAGREWIEIFNAGPSPVHFLDWKFFEDNKNHDVISVQGGENLASGAYAIIADNPTKFLQDWSYSGILFDSTFSLGNSGETLAVHMPPPDLTETDSITYQSAWGATGNGNSLQRTSASGTAFSEAPPTPGSGSLTASAGSNSNATSSSSSSSTTTSQTTQTTTTTTTTSSPVSSYVTPPEIQIFADGGDDRTVIVGADTEFYGRAYNRDKEELARVRFSWNFGDGSTAEGITVLHHFDYPGRYAVVLNIAEHRSAASDVIVVVAEPAQLSFTSNADGSVSIGNEAGRDLDLSRWVVRSFGREFVLPEHSIILKGAVTHILQKTLGFPAGLQTELAYPNGVVALRAGEDTLKAAPPVTTAPAAPLAVIPPPVLPTRPVSFDAPPEMPEQTAEVEAVEEATSSQVAASAALVGGGQKWWLGVLALSFASTGAVYLARHYARKEWNIIEESPK